MTHVAIIDQPLTPRRDPAGYLLRPPHDPHSLGQRQDSPPAGPVAVFVDPFGRRWFLNQPS